MKKIFLFLVVLIIGLKIVGTGKEFAVEDLILKLALQDEESKKEKEDNQKGKRYNEEFCHNFLLVQSLAATIRSRSYLNHQKLYFSFVDQPNTPPPNFI